jgi:catechol 2,3-dioxygenase-like lactoylglutathione lyase family enzyme
VTIAGSVLDHIAVGVRDIAGPTPWLRDLGAIPLAVEDLVGFRTQHWLFASGMRMEVLAPHDVDENDFLERFIERDGPGAHHVTFAVPDLADATAQLEDAGFPILYSNVENPAWREAFVHPRHACGTVLQLAQCPGWDLSDVKPPTADLPVVHLEVKDIERALTLYRDLLGGAEHTREELVLLSWPGTGSIALHERADMALPGRVAALEISGPGAAPGFPTSLGVEFVTAE